MTNIPPIEAFSDPTRRQLLERLRAGSCSVSELVDAVRVSQSAVSQHLRILLAARLVQVRRQGQQRIYSLDPAGLAELRAYLERFWDRVAEAYQDAAAYIDDEERVMNEQTPAQETILPITKSFGVKLSQSAAFHLFTADIARWWPLKSHSVFGDEAISCVVEPHAGGRIYEIHADGRQSEWGQVLAWDPPRRLACSWYPGRDSATAQELEVTFAAEDGGTRVTLAHSGWESLGERGPAARNDYDHGWDGVLQAYINLAGRY